MSAESTDMAGIAERLRAMREEQGLSGRALAERAGLNASHVEQLENQRTKSVVAGTIQALAAALGCRTAYLLEGELPKSAVGERTVERIDRYPAVASFVLSLRKKGYQEAQVQQFRAQVASLKGEPTEADLKEALASALRLVKQREEELEPEEPIEALERKPRIPARRKA